MTLALLERLVKAPFSRPRQWTLPCRWSHRLERAVPRTGHRQWASRKGSRVHSTTRSGHERFHCFALHDLGVMRLLGQVKAARNGSIVEDPKRWGMEHIIATDSLELECGKPVSIERRRLDPDRIRIRHRPPRWCAAVSLRVTSSRHPQCTWPMLAMNVPSIGSPFRLVTVSQSARTYVARNA